MYSRAREQLEQRQTGFGENDTEENETADRLGSGLSPVHQDKKCRLYLIGRGEIFTFTFIERKEMMRYGASSVCRHGTWHFTCEI